MKRLGSGPPPAPRPRTPGGRTGAAPMPVWGARRRDAVADRAPTAGLVDQPGVGGGERRRPGLDGPGRRRAGAAAAHLGQGIRLGAPGRRGSTA